MFVQALADAPLYRQDYQPLHDGDAMLKVSKFLSHRQIAGLDSSRLETLANEKKETAAGAAAQGYHCPITLLVASSAKIPRPISLYGNSLED